MNLKKVLSSSEIRKGINHNLLCSEVLEEAISKSISLNKNCTLIKIVNNGQEVEFENTMHYSEDKDIYLLESRTFLSSDGSMVNAYLEMFNNNLEIINDYQDDVWQYADWKVI